MIHSDHVSKLIVGHRAQMLRILREFLICQTFQVQSTGWKKDVFVLEAILSLPSSTQKEDFFFYQLVIDNV